jgi:hypothetical protein
LLVAAPTSRREHWLDVVRAWKASGLSRSEFATKAGVSPQTLGWYAWRLEADGERTDERPPVRRVRKATKPSPTVQAVELAPRMSVVELTPLLMSDHRVELEVAGITVRLPADFDAAMLTRLLEVLEARR